MKTRFPILFDLLVAQKKNYSIGTKLHVKLYIRDESLQFTI